MTNMRSITSLLFRPSKPALPETKKPNLTTLPLPLLEQIASHLSTEELTRLGNACLDLKGKISSFFSARRQQRLIQARILQSTVPAANLPTELLQEIFLYLAPQDFYFATKVCKSWRYAGVYPQLIKKHIHALRPIITFTRVRDTLNYDLQTLSRNLHRAGILKKGVPKHLVSTIQLEQPGSKIPPAIHLSESGHYFLSAERAPPYQVHIYCTYRPVIASDFEIIRNQVQIKNPKAGSKHVSNSLWGLGSEPLGFNEWDSTPTHLVKLPCKGKVVSASFSPAVFGGVKYDRRTNSYSKGVDVLVLFEGGWARLFKIRSAPTDREVSKDTQSWRKPLRPKREPAKWYIWDSMEFSGIGSTFPNEKPILAKLEETNGRAVFASEGHLEVWKGISGYNSKKVVEGGQLKEEYWDKTTAVRGIYPLPGAPRNLERIFVGNSWHSGLCLNTTYIICASSPFPRTEKQLNRLATGTENDPEETLIYHLEPDPSALNTEPIEILRSSSTLPYRVLTSCEDYDSTSLYFGLNQSKSLTYLKLWHNQEVPYKPCMLTQKRRYCHPHAPPIHMASVNIHWHSIHPIIATATAEGNIYISFPPLCNSKERACLPKKLPALFIRCKSKCSCPPPEFKKLARIPPDTGGRITDMRISYRSPVLDSPRRNVLYLKDLQVFKDEKSMLVLLISTDKGRLEVCYFGGERKRIGAKRLWAVKGSEIKYKSDSGEFI